MKCTLGVESLEEGGGGVIFGWELRLKCWRSDDWSDLTFFDGGLTRQFFIFGKSTPKLIYWII